MGHFQNGISRYVHQYLKPQSKLMALIAAGFFVSLLAGMAIVTLEAEPIASWLTAERADYEQIERIFGKYRESVRDGELVAMATCILLVFGINTLGSILRSISTLFVLPVAVLILEGCMIGAYLLSLQGSSYTSVILFLSMAGIEWVTCVLSATAGAHIGLAVVSPKRVGLSSRWAAFKRAGIQAGSLYLLIIAILAVHAVFELLYVRKVLLMGGTGIPLLPW